MTNRKEFKTLLVDNLEYHLDFYMNKNNFYRKNGSLVYKRKIGEATQLIDINFEMKPKDNTNAIVAIYPKMEVLIPKVDAILREMIGEDIGLLEGITGGTSRQPIGFNSSKLHTGRWFVCQIDSIREIIIEIKFFIEKWTVPFLDIYSSPEEIIAADKKKDNRISHDRSQLLRVISAAISCECGKYALEVLESKLGTVGARRRYDKVYSYVRGAINGVGSLD